MSVLSEAVLQTTRDVASRRSHQGGAHDRGNSFPRGKIVKRTVHS